MRDTRGPRPRRILFIHWGGGVGGAPRQHVVLAAALTRRERLRATGALALILIVAFGLRLASPSPGTLVRGDHAFLAAWSRQVAEATTIQVPRRVFAGALETDRSVLGEELLREPGNLIAALVFGLSRTVIRVQDLLDVLLLAAWFRIVGFSPGTAELFMILVSATLVAALYATAWVIWGDRRIALMSAALMAVLPGSLYTARWVSWHLFGQLLMTLAVLAGLLGIAAYQRTGRRWPVLAAGGVWGVSLYSNVLLPFLAPVILLPAFLRSGHRGSIVTAVVATYAAGAAFVILPAVVVVGLRWSSLVGTLSAGLKYGRCCSIADRLDGLLSSLSAMATVPVLLLCLYGGWLSMRTHGRPRVIAAWLAAFVISAAALGTREMGERIVLFGLPAVVLAAAAASVRVHDRLVRTLRRPYASMIFLAGALALVLTLVRPATAYLRLPPVRTAQWRAVEWVLQRAGAGAVIVTNLPHGVHVLAPSPRNYTVVDADALLNHRQRGDALANYLSWRYSRLPRRISQTFVLLSVAESPAPPEREILDLVSRELLRGERLVDQSHRAGFVPDVHVYMFERGRGAP